MTETKDKQLQMRVDDAFLATIDDWRRQQPAIPSRADAIRRLVSWGILYSDNLAIEEKEEARRQARRERTARERR